MAVVLSRRMQALAEMVTPGSLLADVGCDHGFISIYLVQQGICPRVCAMDINPGPLQRAREHVAACGLENYIDIRLSDGVSALLPGEADALLCAGMGGRLMQRILTQGRERAAAMREMILQPQSEIADFRRFLRMEGYEITRERMVLEDGKYYPMMKAVPVRGGRGAALRESVETQAETQNASVLQQKWKRLADKFGGLLIEQRDPVLRQYLCGLLEKYEMIMGKLSSQAGAQEHAEAREERKRVVLEEMEDVRMALSRMEGSGEETTI